MALGEALELLRGVDAAEREGVLAELRSCEAAGAEEEASQLTRLDIAERPSGASWTQIYGMALLCGIGFTMSLFIGALAFPGQALLVEEAKGGILMGSVLSALAGFAVLRWAAPARKRDKAVRQAA